MLFITEGQKRSKLMEVLRSRARDDKIIVFVNVKKNVDTLGRFLEKEVGRPRRPGVDWTVVEWG